MKIAVFLAPGFEEIEALTVVDYLRRAEQNVTTVSVPEDGSSVTDIVVKGSHAIPVVADILLKDYIALLDGKEPDAVYFPGGMPGAKNLSDNQFLFQLITKMARKGKLVAAVCASPAVVLAPTGILAEKKWKMPALRPAIVSCRLGHCLFRPALVDEQEDRHHDDGHGQCDHERIDELDQTVEEDLLSGDRLAYREEHGHALAYEEGPEHVHYGTCGDACDGRLLVGSLGVQRVHVCRKESGGGDTHEQGCGLGDDIFWHKVTVDDDQHHHHHGDRTIDVDGIDVFVHSSPLSLDN